MRGLRNAGNTCYLNAALHFLLYNPPLVNYALSGLAREDLLKKRMNACALAEAFVALANEYWTTPLTANPDALDAGGVLAALRKLHKPFAAPVPHDAHEALVLLTRHAHEAWGKTPPVSSSESDPYVDAVAWRAHNAKVGYSMITELFQGQAELVTESECGFRSVSHEHFTALSLDVCASVGGGIARWEERETIDGYTLPDGREVSVRHQRKIRYLPPILVVHIKRFLPDGAKNTRFVDYSTTLDLTGVGSGGVYDLYAVCFHRGSHYTAACEVCGRWYTLDDDRATEIRDINAVVDKDAYMLAFKKRHVR